MRDGWEDIALGQLIRRRSDFTTVQPDADYVILGVQRSGWGFVQREPMKGRDQKFTKLMRVETDDLVYRTITAFEAPSAVAGPEQAGLYVTPQTFPVFRIDDRHLLPAYMRLITTWPRFHDEMATRCTGTVLRRKTLSIGAFESIPIPVPPLPEQRRIVDLIGALDDTIDRLMACAAAASEAQGALRRYLLAGGTKRSKETIGDVAQAVTGRAFPARFQGRAVGVYPYIKCSDMNADGQELVLSEAANWIDESVSAQLGAKILPTGTVIFPILGAALATEKRRVLGRPAAFDQNVMGLVPGPMITSEFLLAVMSETSLARLSQQGAVPSVNQSIVSSISICLPSLDEQRRIGGLLAASAEGVRKARQAARALRTVREHALSSLLSGGHEIPESYDELMEVAS